jgi:hypothetical protein
MPAAAEPFEALVEPALLSEWSAPYIESGSGDTPQYPIVLKGCSTQIAFNSYCDKYAKNKSHDSNSLSRGNELLKTRKLLRKYKIAVLDANSNPCERVIYLT